MRSPKLAEAAALLPAYDEATDADYAWSGLPSDRPGAEQRFHEIRDRLFVLNAHTGSAAMH
jgi:hypothetical protein